MNEVAILWFRCSSAASPSSSAAAHNSFIVLSHTDIRYSVGFFSIRRINYRQFRRISGPVRRSAVENLTRGIEVLELIVETRTVEEELQCFLLKDVSRRVQCVEQDASDTSDKRKIYLLKIC